MEPVLRVQHTADLGGDRLDEVRALLDAVFGATFGDSNFEHALGGMHATVDVDGALVAHGAVGQRRLLHDGRVLRAGYVEALAVHPDRRGEGHAEAIMDVLERLIRGAYELGALGASDDGRPLYLQHGWRPWPGTLSTLSPSGLRRTPDDEGGILVYPVSAPAYWTGDLACDWRAGEVW